MPRAKSRRAQTSAIISEMLMVQFQITAKMVEEAPATSAIAALWPIRVNDAGQGNAPLSITAVAKKLGMPRETVRRAIERLADKNIITKMGGGYIGNQAFYETMSDDDVRRAINAVLTAADRLRELL